MKRKLSTLLSMLVLSGVVAVAPTGAQANHCAQTNLILFTFVGGQFDLAQNNLVCLADPDDEIYDTRLIKPGATLLAGRHSRACTGGSTLPGTMSGLVNQAVTFSCSSTIDGTPGTVMDTEDVPLDPTLSGTVTLTIDVPTQQGIVTLTTCYHTIDASCPDMP